MTRNKKIKRFKFSYDGHSSNSHIYSPLLSSKDTPMLGNLKAHTYWCFSLDQKLTFEVNHLVVPTYSALVHTRAQNTRSGFFLEKPDQKDRF